MLYYLCFFIPFPPSVFSLPALAALDGVVQREITEVKNKLDQNSVHNTLQTVKQLISPPAGDFDVHAVIAALEHLVDMAREKNDAQASRYNSILKQTRPLSSHASFHQVLLKLLGDKEEIVIAKEEERLSSIVPVFIPLWQYLNAVF